MGNHLFMVDLEGFMRKRGILECSMPTASGWMARVVQSFLIGPGSILVR